MQNTPPRASEATPELGRATLTKVGWRLLPFLLLLYVVAWLDRVNVGFAALQMNADLGFSATVYGFGAGIFFIGYALFEVPSNLILARVGARLWIARIMITWGILSVAMMFVSGPISFYVLRFLLGVAEAGFLPGIIYYLGNWYPAKDRARAVSWFMLAIPLSTVSAARSRASSSSSTAGTASKAGNGCSCSKAYRPSCSASSSSVISRTRPTKRVARARGAALARRAHGERAARRASASRRRPGAALVHPTVWLLGLDPVRVPDAAATGSRCGSRRSSRASRASATSWSA